MSRISLLFSKTNMLHHSIVHSFTLLICATYCIAIPELPDNSNTTRGKIEVSNPKLLKEITKEEVEKARGLPLIPPLGTSTFHLARLAQNEVEVAEKLTRMAQTLLAVHGTINRYLSSWDELAKAGVETPGWVEHPLHAYALTKHVSLGWPALEDTMTLLKDLTPDADWLLARRNSSGVATQEDLTTVAGGVARLHDFYTFNITAFSKAQLTSVLDSEPALASVSPTLWDMYCIGSEAARINIWGSGVDFLREALDRYNASSTSFLPRSSSSSSTCSTSNCHPFDNEDDTQQLPKTFQKVAKMHDQVLERKGSRSKSHSTHAKPLDKTLARKKKYHNNSEKAVTGMLGTHVEGQIQYYRLCRGEDLRPPNVTSKLYCRYVTNGSPLYIIGPLRMEVHSLSPYVVTIEDVVTSLEAHEIQQVSASFLQKSSTFRFNGQQEVTYQRTSSTAWLWEHNSVHMPILTDRIEALTGLNCLQNEGAETYQVVNYGIGGHYTVHHDAIGNIQSPFNRVATFLIYLTDVPQGGSTVFPWVGVGVQPKRGRALLWYNMNRAGLRDDMLEHAACPVLLGDKWVINKWVYYGGQMNSVPCKANDPYDDIAQPLY